MGEELGVELGELTSLGVLHVDIDHRKDALHLFTAELGAPELTLQLSELAEARWFPRRQLPGDLARFVRPILARANPQPRPE
jgi:hypothetical protein